MRELLSDFIDRSLHWRTARSLEVHLAACPPCRCYVASVERTIVLYRERPVVDVPLAVRGHLRELLRERLAHAPKKSARGRSAATGSRTRVASGDKPKKKSAKKP